MSSLPMLLRRQTQPLMKIPSTFLKTPWKQQRDKVVFILGATGTGKSRLSIDLATSFPAEIINSDKIQVYKGLDIATNKVTEDEQCEVPHHLLGILNPHVDYSVKDFCVMATHAVESILQRGKLPIIVGGSNSYIESLVSDGFGSKYDCCFLWVDVCASVLYPSVSKRVDQMVESGIVNEVREFFDPSNKDYTRGIRRAIGVPELDTYFRTEHQLDESGRRAEQLQFAISEIKENTCKLANKQVQKIYRLKYVKGWELNRFDATDVFKKYDKDDIDQAWQKRVKRPSLQVLTDFLNKNDHHFESDFSPRVATRSVIGNNQALVARS